MSRKIARDSGFMRGEAAEILEKLLELMKAALLSGEDAMVSEVGKRSVMKRIETGCFSQSHVSMS